MTQSLPPYPAYKDSGVPWLGDIPTYWQRLPGRACFAQKKTPNVGLQETTVLSLSFGQIVVKPPEKLHGLVPASFETYQIIEPNDIVIRPTDLQNDWVSLRTGLARTRGIITSAYICLQTKESLIPEYGRLLLHAYDLNKVFYGLGSGLRQNLDWRDFKYLPCLVPPPAEQAAIARFLDYVDRRIRRYVAAKKKLIALLNEQKQAIIHRAVTRGLDPNVRLKPAGLEWLGEIPEHWRLLPLKRWVSTKITDGPHETPSLLDDGIPFMSAESMVGGHFDFSHRRGFISQEVHEIYCQKCRPQRNDIFMCKSGATTGKVAMVETDQEFSVWSPLALIRAHPKKAVPHLLFLVLQSDYVQRQVQLTWSYGTQPNLSMAAMERIAVMLPPIDEQYLLLEHLKQETSVIQDAANRAEAQISLLREYRISLIADVVTGKLDVRQAAAHLPEEAEEPSALEESEETDEDEADDGSDELSLAAPMTMEETE